MFLQVAVSPVLAIGGLAMGLLSQAAQEDLKLVPSDAEYLQAYGSATAVEGDTLVVGAIGSDPEGAFYSYKRVGVTWRSEARVDGPSTGSVFGRPLSLDDGVLVVGDTGDSNSNGQSAGAAYVYEKSSSGWSFVQKLIAPNGTQFDNFSSSLAIAKNTIVVGAFNANGIAFLSGSAYVFEYDGSQWVAQQTLFPSQGGTAMGFGLRLAIDDEANRIAVAARDEDINGLGNVGAVYVFKRVPDGWVEEARLWDSTAPGFEYFGASVDLDGDRMLIGANGNDDMGIRAGAAWVYEFQGGSWTPVDKFYASDTFQDHRFGHHARLAGDTALVSGHLSLAAVYKIYQFQRTGSQWNEVAQLVNSDNANFDGFGENFAFEGGNIVLSGASGAYSGPIRSGAAYVHVLDVPAVPYCTGKTNSVGCVPTVSSSGSPTFTGVDDFSVGASGALPSTPGLFFFGSQGPLSVPFFEGTLCVAPPLARTTLQLSSAGPGCSPTFSFAVGQPLMVAYGLYPGQTVHGQYWMRDPNQVDGTGVGLSNALEFSIQP